MKEMKLQPIKNGTVIDHIEPGMAMKVARILGIPETGSHSAVSIAMFVKSDKMKTKDLLKIEDRELKPGEVNRISLISPNATICIIENFNVTKKSVVSLPSEVTGIAKCSNPNCITNKGEPLESEFTVENHEDIKLRCKYCERYVNDIMESII